MSTAQPHATAFDPSVLDPNQPIKAEVRNLNVWYGTKHAVRDVSLDIPEHRVTAIIGPSGCGKSTLLRCFNRMHDLYPNCRYDGGISLLPGRRNIIDPSIEPIEVRMKISMVFQKPNPFPKSIFENVAYGLRVRGESNRKRLVDKVEAALRSAALWDETKDRLDQSAMSLSGGQQQRLCIARAVATDPEMVLFDEPTSALDPTATSRIEDLVDRLKSTVTVLIVTHNMQQAARIADFTAFMYLGELIEFGRSTEIFTAPRQKLTNDYLTGRFG